MTGQPFHPEPDLKRGALSWFAHNHVAANLLMLLVMVGGALSLMNVRREVFPTVETGIITVRVPYPGASPEEVEEGVCVRIEEALAGVEGIQRLRSVASENIGSVIAELEDYADSAEVLDDIESEVNRINTFPQETERPVIAETSNRVQVLSIVLYGDVPERALKQLAEQLRDDLTTMPEISLVDLTTVRRFEISIEVSEEALRRWGLTFAQVADAVRASSMDLPGGVVKTRGGEILIRSKGQRYTGPQFEDIILLSRSDGTTLRLGQVANVVDGFEDTDLRSYFDGKRSAMIRVFAVGEQDSLEVAGLAKQYVAEQRGLLPAGVAIETWFDRSLYLESRIDLLLRNARIGLVLVFLSLALFLDLRLAFWTTMGIPISFLGAFWMLPAFGVTVNMISLFAFIVVLGIVVDDAIVVGENIFEHRQRGKTPMAAAVIGVREMAAPVTMAVLTTVVAFLPLVFTAGEIGKIVRVIPVVVISVLLISLVEALLILPSHLSTLRQRKTRGPIARVQAVVRDGLQWVIDKPYAYLLDKAVRWRYATVAIALALLLTTMGYVAGGHIKFVFFPKVDADNVVAQLTMPRGTPVEQTEQVVRRLEQAAERVRQRVDAMRGDDEQSMVKHISTTVGQQPFGALVSGAAQRGTDNAAGGDGHLAEINVELLSSEFRDIPSDTIGQMWREEVGEVPGVSSLTFTTSFFSAGEAINVELSHRNFEQLLAAVDQLKGTLANYAGVTDIKDSFEPGKLELKLSLKAEGRNLGLTLEDLARQVRQGFYGEEAQRIQRQRDDIKVMVRFPEDERRSLADVENMRIRLPGGVEVPFRTVAEATFGRGYAQIVRADRRRIVSVTAAVNEAVNNADEINRELAASVMPQLQRASTGLVFSFEGEQREQRESMTSLAINCAIAMLAIFAILGVQFRSYVQPLIVMSAIPFGLVGAVGGHVLMGLDLSFLSGFGIVALTGVVVNDSLIMIDLINRESEQGVPIRQTIIDCGMRRFRPIMLTTLTTFCGLTPMLLERSLQARFLVPMAVSLAFGVAFATAITLLLVPALYRILVDITEKITGFEEPKRGNPASDVALRETGGASA